MPRLDDNERKSFTTDKLAHLDRVRDARQEELLDLDTSDYTQEEGESIAAFSERKSKDAEEHRAKVVGQLANMPTDQLRARLNVKGFRGSIMEMDADSDYTAEELEAIQLGYKANVGRSWGREIPAILAHDAEMKRANIGAATRKAILKARGGN
jgi:hypothetical protein